MLKKLSHSDNYLRRFTGFIIIIIIYLVSGCEPDKEENDNNEILLETEISDWDSN